MREHGWDTDAWPELFGRVLAADILVIAGPIWLGDNSSETKKIIERLYAHSGELNDRGQWLYYGKVGGCLITGNEDGIKHCASKCSTRSRISVSQFHLKPMPTGRVRRGPGPSYRDEDNQGGRNHWTTRNTVFAAWNLLHTARRLVDGGAFPPLGIAPLIGI